MALKIGNWGYNSYKWSHGTLLITGVCAHLAWGSSFWQKPDSWVFFGKSSPNISLVPRMEGSSSPIFQQYGYGLCKGKPTPKIAENKVQDSSILGTRNVWWSHGLVQSVRLVRVFNVTCIYSPTKNATTPGINSQPKWDLHHFHYVTWIRFF